MAPLPPSPPPPPWIVFASAGLGACVAEIATLPIDTAKVRLQLLRRTAGGGGGEPAAAARGMGMRCQRFSMFVEDGVLRSLNIDAGGKFEVTDAQTMLSQLG